MRTFFLFALAACHGAPAIEVRTPTPTTTFCKPHAYNLPTRQHEHQRGEPLMSAGKDGLEVDHVVAFPRTSAWDPTTGDIYSRWDLESGNELMLFQSNRMDDDPRRTRDDYAQPYVAYLWNPATREGTLLGRGYFDPNDIAMFIVMRDRKLFYTDIDETSKSLRILGPYLGETLAGQSSGTAVLYSLPDASTVAVRCLGDNTATRYATPKRSSPASADAVRDQRLLLLGATVVDGKNVSAPAYVLDLDRARVRYVGIAPGRFEDAHTNVPSSRAVVRLGWSDGDVVTPLGSQDNARRISVATERIAPR